MRKRYKKVKARVMEKQRPKTWKGLCGKCWKKKQNGDLLSRFPIFGDDWCWSCGKKLNFNEPHHRKP